MTVAAMVLANGGVLAIIHGDLPEDLRPAAVRWHIATALVCIGCGVMAFGESLPLAPALVVANTAMVSGLIFYHHAIQTFYGERPSPWDAGVAAVMACIIFWFSAVSPSFIARIVIVTLLWLLVVGRTIATLGRARHVDPSRSRRILMCIYMLAFAFLVVRAGVYLHHTPAPEFRIWSGTTSINLTSPIVLALLPVIGSTAFILMCADHMRRQLAVAAATDYLTGLANRRTLADHGESLIRRARDHHGGFGIVVFDLDDFKRVNDSHGHHVGDQALVHVAAHLRMAARPQDLAARSGGEEFILLLDGMDEARAAAEAERIRAALSAHPFRPGPLVIPLTVSAGVTAFRPEDRDFDAMLRRADRALYRAKAAGRDRVERAG